MIDSYRTIVSVSEGSYKEKMSKFLSFAVPVRNIDEVKEQLDQYQKRFYDARHLCYAYMLGHERTEFRSNDNGEPSGTAGKPILGQINSMNLTDVLVIVVRYFGGIKLGTSGLIVAYREAAAEALRAATIEERTVDGTLTVDFTYPYLNEVMRVIKESNARITDQHMEESCRMTLSTRLGELEPLAGRLRAIDYTLRVKLTP